MAKERLDKILVDRGLAPSRERARAMILGGKVLVSGQVAQKAGDLVGDPALVTLREEDHPYVSRGALKLVKGLEHFALVDRWTRLPAKTRPGWRVDHFATRCSGGSR